MKLMVLDGNSVINRAYYGVRALTTRDGFFTNAIYGFLNILEKERSEEKPDALCVAFDLHAPTFRHLRYDGYKATRHPMPEEPPGRTAADPCSLCTAHRASPAKAAFPYMRRWCKVPEAGA